MTRLLEAKRTSEAMLGVRLRSDPFSFLKHSRDEETLAGAGARDALTKIINLGGTGISQLVLHTEILKLRLE